MGYNLLKEKWLPVIRADGGHDRIAPFEIVGGDSPAVDLNPPRPDFRAAMLEFLVGLLQTSFAPEQEGDWLALKNNPPSQERLGSALEAHVEFFELFGDRPRFMQDLTLSEKDKPARNNIAGLLIDSPGGNTLKLNTDFFIKRGGVEVLCPSCAAMAIYTLQSFAPSGGKGHRTSLRGGGPLSTLAGGDTLWEKAWHNVFPHSFENSYSPPSAGEYKGNVYPWAEKTRTSEKGEEVSPDDVHPLHAYWAMPRRIVLEESAAPETCSICGERADVTVRSYLTRPSGYNYDSSWTHPLTPYREQTGNPPLSIKGQADISAYSHWLGLVYGQPYEEGVKKQNVVRPARCVQYMLKYPAEYGVNASGYDMDNMKALQWCEHTFPIYSTKDNEVFRHFVHRMVKAADRIRSNLVSAVKDAVVNDAGKNQAKVDKSFFANIGNSFWAATEGRFYALASDLAFIDDDDLEKGDQVLEKWARYLMSESRKLFEKWVMSVHIPPERYERYIEAGKKMGSFNYSYLVKNGLLTKGETK